MKQPIRLVLYCRLLLILLCLLPTACFFSMQSFNHGKLLNPGEARTSYSMGWRPISQITESPAETLTTNNVISVNYRLGVLAKHPLGKGLEIGFHFEAPLQQGNPMLEFDGRLGLPTTTINSLLYHHNVGIGWIVGQWVDNGWYLEYAGGFEGKYVIPYANIRCILTATAVDDLSLVNDSTFLSRHEQHGLVRGALGCTFKLPRIPVIPDFITPEFSVVYPDRWTPKRFTWSCQIGLGWQNGL